MGISSYFNTYPFALLPFFFSRITGPFIIKENADTGLKNVCCGDSWQITAHGTQFYSPGLAHRHRSWPTFLSFTPIPGGLLQQKVDLSLIMISVLSHYLFDKEKIVLSSNKTEFSSPFGWGGRGDKTNFPIPPKMVVTLWLTSHRHQLQKYLYLCICPLDTHKGTL